MVYILVFIANRIESEGVKYLYEGLVNNYSLNTISLYCIFEYIKGNNINDEGAESIQKLLSIPDKSSIKVLNLDRNNISENGLMNIYNGICNGGKDIEILNLSHNSINDNGALIISKILNECGDSIRELNIEGNFITSVGCKALRDGLVKCKCLYYLNICSNPFESDGIKELKDGLSSGNIVDLNLNSIIYLFRKFY